MPALTRNRRFARSRNSSERAGTPAGAGSIQTVEASGAEPGQFLSDTAPCARSAGGVVSEGPARVAYAFASCERNSLWETTSGRVRGFRALVVGTVVSLALVGASAGSAGAATNTQTSPARGAMARQPDSPQRRLPEELRFRRRDRHHVRSDRPPRSRRRPRRVERCRRVSQDQDRHEGAERRPGHAGGARRIHHGGGRDRTESAHLRRISGEEQPRRRLLDTERTTGPDAGLFGAQDPTYDGAFREGLALSALAAVHIPKTDPRIVGAISWLTKQQCSNGLWEAYRSDASVACPPSNPNAFTGPDTNSTGFAVQGLGAWGKHPGQAALLHSLDAVQSSDGGFPDIASHARRPTRTRPRS